MTRNPLFDIPHYLRVVQSYLGARMYLIFGLALFAVLAEGVGILMLLPLLGGLDAGGAEPTGVAAVVQSMLSAVGLGGSTTWLLVLITAAFIAKGALLFLANGYRAYLQGLLLRELRGRLFDRSSHMRYRHYVSESTGNFTKDLQLETVRSDKSDYRAY